MMPGLPTGRISQRGVLVTCALTVFLIALNTTAINAAVNALAGDLDLSTSTLSWALNAYMLAGALGAVVAFVGLRRPAPGGIPKR